MESDRICEGTRPQFGVFQLGARRHYAVPRLLHAAGMLSWLRTDLCSANWPLSLLRAVPGCVLPASLVSLRDRYPEDIPASLVRSFPVFGLRYSRRPAETSRSAHWVSGGRKFCQLVLNHGFGSASGVYGFTGAALEVFEAGRSQNRLCVLDQIMAPRAIEQRLLSVERERFPEWEAAQVADSALDQYVERERSEWACADRVVCGSEFVRDGVVACGGRADRCVVIPYGTNRRRDPVERMPHRGRLRVVVVGEIGLRKGSPYVLEAARRLKDVAEFRVVGAVSCAPAVRRDFEASTQLTGIVPRSAIAGHLRWADVFLLPSLCEGSSGAVFEALAASLPVICTKNTGSVIQDGREGFIIPTGSADGIVRAVELLAGNAEMRSSMSEASGACAEEWTLAGYGQRLTSMLLELVSEERANRSRRTGAGRVIHEDGLIADIRADQESGAGA